MLGRYTTPPHLLTRLILPYLAAFVKLITVKFGAGG